MQEPTPEDEKRKHDGPSVGLALLIGAIVTVLALAVALWARYAHADPPKGPAATGAPRP